MIIDVQDVLKVSTPNIHRMLFHIPQKFLRVSPAKKTEVLLEILEKDAAKKKKILIFSNKATTSDFIQIFLNENNIDCVNFNANHLYKYRRGILDRFLTGEVSINKAFLNVINISVLSGEHHVLHRPDVQGYRHSGRVPCHQL